MRFPAKCVALTLPLALTACVQFPFHKAKQSLPPQKTASRVAEPPPQPIQLPPEPLPPVFFVPKPVVVFESTPPRKLKSTQRKSARPVDDAEDDAAPAAGSQDAGAGETPAVSAVGQLSSGDSSDLTRRTSDSILDTERGLDKITRTLTDSEKKTADQIREFLKQARVALVAQDVDGASTLVAKAKVLLAELNE
jgi:hypothetical protein